jgi:hypothetical protein
LNPRPLDCQSSYQHVAIMLYYTDNKQVMQIPARVDFYDMTTL